MKNKITISVLATLAIITSSGLALSHNDNKILQKTVEKQMVDLNKKSTKIANLEKVIAEKDDDLKAKEMVIDNNNAEINKLKLEVDELKKYIGSREMVMNASGYIALCSEGCTGKTASGENVADSIYYDGMRVIASDLSVLPMYSIVEIEGFSDRFIVLDTGGAIKGNKIDILFNSTYEARQFGRKNVKVRLIRKGVG